MIVWQRPNLLLLDEPTNHLDLATREALSMALNEFEGTVMLVSHDRALLRAVCDEFWLVTRGGVEPFDGDLDDYQRYLLEEGKRLRDSLKDADKEIKSTVPQPAAAPPTVQRAASGKAKPLKQALDKIDKNLAALQIEKTRLETRLSQAKTAPEIADAGEHLQRVNLELAQLEEAWLSLSDEIETLT
jgi:ATP-binding cassette subfamily F protein 3